MVARILALLPHGYSLPEDDWRRRHRIMLWVLAVHVPLLIGFGVVLAHPPLVTLSAISVPVVALLLGRLLTAYRRTSSVIVTIGLVYCSAALVGLTAGAIEAHFHFFIIIGFIALYQDWVPFLVNVGFTVLSHGVGSAWQNTLIFSHTAGQTSPWTWSLIHGVSVLAACVGLMLFWRVTEEQQVARDELTRELAEAELGRRQFTSDLLVNLARRNQGMLHRQLEIINQLEESERDPDALGELFRLDHLTTRVRRNAESLLVLSGEQSPRMWSDPIPLLDVVRAAIAETEDLDRVLLEVDERPAVVGRAVSDLTHLIAELAENAVHFSPPGVAVTVRSRPRRDAEGGYVLVIEDWGVGMPPDDLAEANRILAERPDIDLAVSRRLGFHVVGRLAARHGVEVSLAPTPGSGVTAVVALPAELFAPHAPTAAVPAPRRALDGGLPARRTADPAAETAPASRRGAVDAPALQRTSALAPARQRSPEPVAAAPRSPEAPPRSPEAAPALQRRPRPAPVAAGSTARVPASPHRQPFASSPEAGSSAVRTGDWPGWWRPDVDGAGPVEGPAPAPTASPTPAPTSAPTTAPAPAPAAASAGPGIDPETGLRRRVPQASLAPELQRTAPAAPAAVVDVDASAAGALSRYQANREAARQLLDDGRA
jgi:signal transduction histidine kinase